MSLRGQRFELDLDAEDFTPKPLATASPSLIGEIKERTIHTAPQAPNRPPSKTGFPAHKKRSTTSTFKTRRHQAPENASQPPETQNVKIAQEAVRQNGGPLPSDRAIAHHICQKYGYDPDANNTKREISEENKQKIAHMSAEDIEEAQAELRANLNPALIERLSKRANCDNISNDAEAKSSEDSKCHHMRWPGTLNESEEAKSTSGLTEQDRPSQAEQHLVPPIHFPPPPPSVNSSSSVSATSASSTSPPIDPSTYQPLDPSAPSFLEDLQHHYFPSTPHDPSAMTWLTDPTETEDQESTYHPGRSTYPISQLRFSFTGQLLTPSQSVAIPVHKGLHHHGLAPSSAGYTVPELAILARSSMPAQRCFAYQILGRLLYRLGRRQLGPPGSSLHDGLWDVIEAEKVIQAMLAETGETGRLLSPAGGGGVRSSSSSSSLSSQTTTAAAAAAAAATTTPPRRHASARAYALEALWLWRRGGMGVDADTDTQRERE